MDTQTQPFWQRFGIYTLSLGLGGAIASFLSLLLGNIIFGRSSRVLTGGMPVFLVIMMVIVGIAAYFIIKRWMSGFASFLAIGGWFLAHFIVNVIAIAFFDADMSIVSYIITWLMMGALGALMFSNSSFAKAIGLAGAGTAIGAGIYAASRKNEVLKASGYGRLPPSTVILLTQHVRFANDAVNQLPPNTPANFRKIAVEVVLDRVIRDWWSNENTDGLTPTDVNDLGAFVQLAWFAARGQSHILQAEAVFRACLSALMDDWFNAWNAEGVEGAPRWQYNS
ncbi:hypothetical protein [Herpetosiphon giganteus]|uniref:hypothetical protein n=1 Tax=Herpetosiphon giganteus TaxID=2029754 RepID=UPI0019599CA9|nr:hypothetical protein [Herpetosiphon giganteus]MBM7842452.1 hypothetical protein [Herpetosiphon giganteus]